MLPKSPKVFTTFATISISKLNQDRLPGAFPNSVPHKPRIGPLSATSICTQSDSRIDQQRQIVGIFGILFDRLL